MAGEFAIILDLYFHFQGLSKNKLLEFSLFYKFHWNVYTRRTCSLHDLVYRNIFRGYSIQIDDILLFEE